MGGKHFSLLNSESPNSAVIFIFSQSQSFLLSCPCVLFTSASPLISRCIAAGVDRIISQEMRGKRGTAIVGLRRCAGQGGWEAARSSKIAARHERSTSEISPSACVYGCCGCCNRITAGCSHTCSKMSQSRKHKIAGVRKKVAVQCVC